jgi:hypothetical protein
MVGYLFMWDNFYSLVASGRVVQWRSEVSAQRNLVRIEQTRAELVRLRREIEDWLGYRRDQDCRKQYSTQLDTLDTFLTTILDALRAKLEGLTASLPTRTVYHECRTLDRRLVWLRHVWRFFGDRFDQRDDERFQDVLEAADEVVWSCYAGFYQNVPGAARRAVPLPFLEPLYVPNAIPRDEPWVLRDRVLSGQFFQQSLAELPLPIIGLPQTCVEAPWWLIYIGHEVGHHLQHDLLPNQQLVGSFGDWLKKAAEAKLLEDEAAGASLPPHEAKIAKKWKAWGQEVFADAFSVYSLGIWAVWAMAELVTGDDTAMLTEEDDYPAPVVRLALMAGLAPKLKQDEQTGLGTLVPGDLVGGPPLPDRKGRDLRQAARLHLDLVPGIVQAIHEFDFKRLGRFESLCGWYGPHFAPGGTIDQWRGQLLEPDLLYPVPSLDAPRLLISAGLAAWAEITALTKDQERADAQAKLVATLPKTIVGSREEGTRSAEEAPDTQDVEARSEAFAQIFMETSVEELGL